MSWPVDEVLSLFGERFEIDRVGRLPFLAENPRFRQRGVTRMVQHVCRLQAKSAT